LKKLFVTFAFLAPASLSLAQTAATPAAAPAVAAAPTTAEDPDKVVLQVGSEKMTVADFNNFVAALPAQVQAMVRGPGKRMLVDRIVDIKLLAQEAQKRSLDQDPKVKMAIQMSREQALAQALAEEVTKPEGDAALKAKYEADKSKYEQVRARHILISVAGGDAPPAPGQKQLTDAEAKAKAESIRDRIVNKKEDFAAIAKAESDDKGSAVQGGELPGFFGRGRMVPEFEQAAFSLKDGEVSQPVKTKYGYHIIQTLERKTPSFEEVKAQLAGQPNTQKLDDLLKQLKSPDTVKIDESFFPAGPAIPGHPGTPPAGR